MKTKLKIYLRFYLKLFSILITRKKRITDDVAVEYGEAWAKIGYNYKELSGLPIMYFVNNRFCLLNRLDRKKLLIENVQDQITSHNFKEIVEVGSGAGFNIICLAFMNPNINFTGVELTEDGINISKKMLENLPYSELTYVTKLNKETLDERAKNIKLKFIKSDARNISEIKDASIDFAYTYLVIEQMANIYKEVFKEVNRILGPGGYVMFNEAFAEFQIRLSQKVFLWANDYFRFSISELQNANLRYVKVESMLESLEMGIGSVLAKKD